MELAVNSVIDFCGVVVILLILWNRHTEPIQQDLQQLLFGHLLLVGLLILTLDIPGWMIIGKQFPGARALNIAINFSYYALQVCNVEQTGENAYSVSIDFSGKVQGMSMKTRYSFEVVGQDENGKAVSYKKKTVRTVGLISRFNDVSYKCTCDVDDLFHFKLDFEDESNYYSDFTYVMIAKKTGKAMRTGTIDDPKAEQLINVRGLPGKAYTLAITYATSDPDDLKEGIASITRNYDVEI